MSLDLRLNHISIPAADIAESARFYRVFGFAEGFTRKDAEGQVDLLQMTGPGGFVELVRNAAPTDAPDRHFGLTTTDLPATLKTLAQDDIHPLEPIRRGISGVDFVFFTDPSGNLVELTAPVR